MNSDISRIPITRTDHRPDEGMSITELVAFATNQSPVGRTYLVSPVVGEWMTAWADWLEDDARQQLRRYLLPLANSLADVATETRRQWLIIDWFLRVDVPIWLYELGLSEYGDLLSAKSGISSPRGLSDAHEAAHAVYKTAHASNVHAWEWFGQASVARTATWQVIVEATQGAAGNAITMAEPVLRAVGYSSLPPEETPPAWRCGLAAIENVTMAMSWRAVGTALAERRWSPMAPDDLQRSVYATVRSALHRGEVSTNDAAHRLTEQLLGISAPSGQH